MLPAAGPCQFQTTTTTTRFLRRPRSLTPRKRRDTHCGFKSGAQPLVRVSVRPFASPSRLPAVGWADAMVSSHAHVATDAAGWCSVALG